MFSLFRKTTAINSKPIKVWCNCCHQDDGLNHVCHSLDALNQNIIYIKNPEQADLWCLIGQCGGHIAENELYNSLSHKPQVIYMADRFSPALNSNWVYFKTPLNTITLKNWMRRHAIIKDQIHHSVDLAETVESSYVCKECHKHVVTETSQSSVASSRWSNQKIQLRHWPNVTNYSDSPIMIQLCARLLKESVAYETLLNYGLNETIIENLLNDAENEDNLIQPSDENIKIAGTDQTDSNNADLLSDKPQTNQFQSKVHSATESAKNHIKQLTQTDDSVSQSNHSSPWQFFGKLFDKLVINEAVSPEQSTNA